jgi:hypothetical protein
MSHIDSHKLLLIYLTFMLLMCRIGRAPNSIPICSCIQQDATSHSLFISGNCSTCFGWYFHPSSESHTTASTASVIYHTFTAICRYRERVGTGLNVLWVAYASRKLNQWLIFNFCYPEPTYSITGINSNKSTNKMQQFHKFIT